MRKIWLYFLLSTALFLVAPKKSSNLEKYSKELLEGPMVLEGDYYEFHNNKIVRYIPEFEKLKELKKDTSSIPFNVCMHRSFAYYSLTQDDSSQIIRGYSEKLPIAHARVIISKFGETFLYDPTWPNFEDGLPQDKDTLWKLMGRFKKGLDAKAYVYRPLSSFEMQIPSNIKSYMESYYVKKTFPKAPSKDSLVSSLLNYAKKFQNN